ncbi:unnamed protein product [Allacma fusca]|uniref:Uncharacterized protein n=1 Tax=Allacma fusca TaxID=39272 RepID=A0A8J2K0H3_9HEXA|nr:unnamed protein product [Allacma fusca]
MWLVLKIYRVQYFCYIIQLNILHSLSIELSSFKENSAILTPIVNAYSHCFIRLIEASPIINYASISTPYELIIIPSGQNACYFTANSFTSNVYFNPIVLKTNFLHCYVGFISENNVLPTPTKVTNCPCKLNGNVIVPSYEANGMQLPEDPDQARMFLKFPDLTFFILTVNNEAGDFQSCFGVYSIRTTISAYTPIYALHFINSTTVLFGLISNVLKSLVVNKDQSETFMEQNGLCDLKNAGDCLFSLKTVYEKWIQHGKAIEWSIQTDSYNANFNCVNINSIIKLRSALSSNAVSILCDGFNVSNWGTYWLRIFPHFRASVTITEGKFYPTGYVRRFNFITADDVWQTNAGLGVYLASFSSQIWSWVAFVAATMVMYLRYIQGMSSLTCACFYALCPLVEQASSVSTKTRHFSWLTPMWLLMSLVLSSSYKGMLKSDFAMTFPIRTNWKYLKDLQNFTLFVSGGDCIAEIRNNRVVSQSKNFYYKGGRVCYDLPYGQQQQFLFYDDSSMFLHLGLNSTKFKTNQFHCTCNQFLKNFIVTELMQPKTAVIALSTDLEGIWRIFEEQTKSNYSLKFAHNGGISDPMFSGQVYYTLKDDWISEEYNLFQKRLEHALAGGLHVFWQMLENAWNPSFGKSSVNGVGERRSTKKPSNVSSGLHIYLVCYFSVVVNLGIVSVFCGEIAWFEFNLRFSRNTKICG